MNKTLAFSGAGLAGLTGAYMFGSQGYKVELLEKMITFFDSGRTYSIQLGPKGITALRELGLWEELRPHAQFLVGQHIHMEQEAGGFFDVFAPYTPDHKPVYCVMPPVKSSKSKRVFE